jgi:hypothetical protein
MNSDRIGHAIMILGSMVLVGSALIVRRERLRGRGGQMALAWVAIFALLIVAGLWLDGHG